MTDEGNASHANRRKMPRTRSNFATRTAADSAERLNRRGSIVPLPSPDERSPLLANHSDSPVDGACDGTERANQDTNYGLNSARGWLSRAIQPLHFKSHPDGKASSTTDAVKPRPGAFPRPVGGTNKLGTFTGVFVPTTLNVLSILMFLRFGFILGQTGVVGMMGEWHHLRSSSKLTIGRYARYLLCHQSLDHHVYFCHRYQRHSPRRWCLLSDIEKPGP
jgi:potassium/chloride transporter 9